VESFYVREQVCVYSFHKITSSYKKIHYKYINTQTLKLDRLGMLCATWELHWIAHTLILLCQKHNLSESERDI